MKHIVIILLLIIVTGSKAQKVKSKFGQDSIVMPPTFIEISPEIVNARGDTARSVYWVMSGFERDFTPGFTLKIIYYDKNGLFLTYENKPILGAQLPNLALIKLKIDSLMKVTQPRIITTP